MTGDKQIVVIDSQSPSTVAVDLPLESVLGKLPPKTFQVQRVPKVFSPLSFPANLTLEAALHRSLRDSLSRVSCSCTISLILMCVLKRAAIAVGRIQALSHK